MDLLSLIKISVNAIFKNKIRAFLTILGIVIGIFSVITLMALGKGAENYILDQVATVGDNLIVVVPGKSDSEFSAPPSQQGLSITSLTYNDAEALKNSSIGTAIDLVAPEVRGQFKTSSPLGEMNATVFGSTAEYFTIRNVKIVEGRIFDEKEVNSLSRLAVVGPKVTTILFPNQNAIGQTIKINQINFTIIGITEDKGNEDGVDLDKVIYLPVTTTQKQLLGINHLFDINIQATDSDSLEIAKQQIGTILRNRHNITDPANDDFTIYDIKQALDILSEITGILSILLGAIAAISLIVGGIGIMNIMLVSVTERTREIGLRKALGATIPDIRTQFLIEAVILTIIGGVVGILLGYFTTLMVQIFSTLRPEITPISVILSLVVASIFGIIFGLYPANKAANLDPITALRYE
ncbi:MAG: ABC transporter permease [Patescibacteria group bacterium]